MPAPLPRALPKVMKSDGNEVFIFGLRTFWHFFVV
jgi:hypothetical protein